jgi:hypothetical protein
MWWLLLACTTAPADLELADLRGESSSLSAFTGVVAGCATVSRRGTEARVDGSACPVYVACVVGYDRAGERVVLGTVNADTLVGKVPEDVHLLQVFDCETRI